MSTATTVLIVEDDRFNVRLLTEICRNSGYEVLVEMDGEAGLAAVAAHRPDLVLLDIMLPKMDGFAVLERVRDNRDTADIPVILVTAIQDVEARNRGIELGADDFISKPFKLFELQTRVKSALQLRQFRRQLTRDITPTAGRVRHAGITDERDALDAAIAARRVSGKPASVVVFRFEGSGAPDVVSAVLAAARAKVAGGRRNLFSRGPHRYALALEGDAGVALALVRELQSIGVAAREEAGRDEPTIHWGVGTDRATADEACHAAFESRTEPAE